MTLRVEGADDLHPYPGLASFTEEDAEYFFGREAEIEQMWRKLEGSSRMLAIAGPSGAGKTSFLQAGLVPHAQAGWGIVRCTPGTTPMNALAGALATGTAGDPDAVRRLLRFHEPDVAVEIVGNWRSGHQRAMLIVDQFEELFTLNPPEVQKQVALLLNRLVLDADIFVLLSLRDDFLFQCHRFEGLRPGLTELTMLGPPEGGALRRALVQPATKCGYRFEDDELVEEMLTEVEGERGALPLLAFALARLWEKRDRDSGLLTRQAYHDIGGVGGALARHAESTVDHIGVERIPIVRELFRNLVTAEGTRAVREWDELLSVFEGKKREGLNPSPTKNSDNPLVGAGFTPARDAAAEVLRELIDARLLTSYEVREDEYEPIRRVEIIHESLLANWPRLVRWQTQDADAAQLRDQLRQAARTWDEQGRSDDTLWTGSAYREFASWRERYPGGLSDFEEAFTAAMTSLAIRRKRRRRAAVTAAFVLFAVVAVVFAGLWRRGVAEQRRAEAQKLVAIGQVRLDDYPTAALAYATSSLELSDSEEARLLALEALWQGPTAFIVNDRESLNSGFSPEANWLVQTQDASNLITIISRDGTQYERENPSGVTTRYRVVSSGRDDLFFTTGGFEESGRLSLWSAPEARLLATMKPVEGPDWQADPVLDEDSGATRGLGAFLTDDLVTVHVLNQDGSHERLGEYRLTSPPENRLCLEFDPSSGDWLSLVDGNDVMVIDIERDGLSEPRRLGRHDGERIRCGVDPQARFFLTVSDGRSVRKWDPSGRNSPVEIGIPPEALPDEMFHPRVFVSDGESYLLAIRYPEEPQSLSIWSFDGTAVQLTRRLENVSLGRHVFDPGGKHLVMRGPAPYHRLWRLSAPSGAGAMLLRRGPSGYTDTPSFSPDGQWLATNDSSGLALWPLSRLYASVISVDMRQWSFGVAFAPDGKFLAASDLNGVRVWPLTGKVPLDGHMVFEAESPWFVEVSPDGETIAAASNSSNVFVGGIDKEVRELKHGGVGSVFASFSPEGRYLASTPNYTAPEPGHNGFHVWEVATGHEVAVLRLEGWNDPYSAGFAGDGRLITSSPQGGVLAWDVETGEREILVGDKVVPFAVSATGLRLLAVPFEERARHSQLEDSPVFFDLDAGVSWELTSHGRRVRAMTLNAEGTIVVTGNADGVIRVGPVTAEEPHLLIGHESEVFEVAIDPLGRWIASCSLDKTVRLWPMPDLSKPPLHTLPREELIAKLKTLTNLRVVRDPESATGWTAHPRSLPGVGDGADVVDPASLDCGWHLGTRARLVAQASPPAMVVPRREPPHRPRGRELYKGPSNLVVASIPACGSPPPDGITSQAGSLLLQTSRDVVGAGVPPALRFPRPPSTTANPNPRCRDE